MVVFFCLLVFLNSILCVRSGNGVGLIILIYVGLRVAFILVLLLMGGDPTVTVLNTGQPLTS